MNSTYKICPKCNSNSIVKNGKQYGSIRYRCKDCNKQFQNKIIKTRAAKSLIQKLTFKKKTISETGLNIKTVRKIIDNYEVIKPPMTPRRINLVCDATFFRSRGDKDGLLIFMDAWTGQVLWIKFIESEIKKEYQEGLKYLEDLGFIIVSVTIDGRRGIPSVFNKYPIQICQFHVQKNILKRTTLKPKSDCGILLKQIGKEFIKDRWSQQDFKLFYNLVKEDFKDFLSERNDNNQFRHRQLRSAITGIKIALPYLFTSVNNPQLRIPNTTNHIDGGINPKLKAIARDHRGMSIPRRNKLMEELLWNLGKNMTIHPLIFGH